MLFPELLVLLLQPTHPSLEAVHAHIASIDLPVVALESASEFLHSHPQLRILLSFLVENHLHTIPFLVYSEHRSVFLVQLQLQLRHTVGHQSHLLASGHLVLLSLRPVAGHQLQLLVQLTFGPFQSLAALAQLYVFVENDQSPCLLLLEVALLPQKLFVELLDLHALFLEGGSEILVQHLH